ncbi:translation elongation factor Ts [Candidatus Gottesmanbacteria bacterium]|nr:translation elongation factor Ts [Candidatus Gottesmanbacteria bacterium]
MTQISIDQIKKLRSQTGAGIMEIKKALGEAGGDRKKAIRILKKMGQLRAAKKAGRETKAGIVETYIHATKTSGATVVLTSETDFVSRTEEFKNLAHEIAMQVCAMNARNAKELLAQPWIRDEMKTVADLIAENIAKFGENIRIADFKRFVVKKV